MTENPKQILTLTGLAGVLAAIAWTVGDALLLDNVATAQEYPILFMIIGSFIDRILPYPLSMWLEGAGLNLGMLFFFTLSLIVLRKKNPQSET